MKLDKEKSELFNKLSEDLCELVNKFVNNIHEDLEKLRTEIREFGAECRKEIREFSVDYRREMAEAELYAYEALAERNRAIAETERMRYDARNLRKNLRDEYFDMDIITCFGIGIDCIPDRELVKMFTSPFKMEVSS